jgi:hypothetical protein
MSGKKSLIEAYLKNLDKKVAAQKAGQNRIGEAAAIQGKGVRMADIPVYRPTIAATPVVSDGKPLELPKVKSKKTGEEVEPARTDGPADNSAADIIAKAFAEQEAYAATQKPLSKKEQRQADQRERKKERDEKAEMRETRKEAIADAKAVRDAERDAAGLAYATAADPTTALPAYKAALTAANEKYEAAKEKAWDPENKKAAPERYDPFVQYAGQVEAELYAPDVIAKGAQSKANPLNPEYKEQKYVNTNPLADTSDIWSVRRKTKDAVEAAERNAAIASLTDDQKAYINYVYGTYEEHIAKELTETLLQNIVNEANAKNDTWLQKARNLEEALVGNTESATAYTAAMLANTGKNIVHGTNLAVPEYSYGAREMSRTQAATQDLVDDAETPVGQFLTGTGIGIGQNVVNTALFGAAAPYVMGVQAAASSGYDAAQNGATGFQQLGKALQGGATEFVTEGISWGKLDDILKNPGAKNFKQAIAQVGAQFAKEAGEEAAGEAINIIYDWMLMGDAGDLKQHMDAYKAEHGGDGYAAELALEILRRVGGAALEGAISGATLGGGATLLSLGNAATPAEMPLGAVQNEAVSDVGENAEPAPALRPVEDFAVKATEITKQHEENPSVKKERLEPQQITATTEKMDTAIRDLTGEDGKSVNVVLTQNAVERMLDKGLTASDIADAVAVLEDFDEAYLSTETSAKFRDKNGGSAKQISFVKNVGDGAVVVNVALDTRNGQYAVADIALDDKGLSTIKAWDGNIDMQPVEKAQESAKVAPKNVPEDAKIALENAPEDAKATGESPQGYAAANVDPQSVGAKKAAYGYKEAPSVQKSTESVLDELTDFEMGELDTAFPAKEDAHQKVSVKQNDELAQQRIEVDMPGEKADLKAKETWNAEDVATAQAILVKLRDEWRSQKDSKARADARYAFNEWYDTVLEHKTVIGQAMRQMQEYVTKIAADDPNVALNILKHEMAKVNEKGKNEFGKGEWKPMKLTAEEINRVENMAEGDTAAFEEIVEDVGKRIQREYPAKVREKITELTKTNMLLNPRTLIKNPLSNLMLQAVSTVSRRVSGLAQAAIHAFDHDFVPVQAFVIHKDSKNIAKDVWKAVGEIVAEQSAKYEHNKEGKSDYSLLKYASKKEVFKPHKRLPFLGTAQEKATGWTADALNAISKRATGAELFREMSSKKSLLENTRQLTYGLLELGDRGFMRAAFVDRMASYIEAKGIKDIKDVPDEAYRLAAEAAFMDTFKDDNAISSMMVEMKNALNKVYAGDLLMPFVKTPANVTARTIEYGPAGFIDTAIQAGKMKKKGIDSAEMLTATIDNLSRNVTGTALVGLGVLLAATGRITGSEPEDKDEAAFLEQAGWRPFSFVTNNGKYISFDWAQPAAMTLILGASMYDNWGKGKGKGLAETAKNLAVTYFDTIFEQSTLQEFESLFGGYGSTGENIIDVMLEYPLRFVSSGTYAAAKATDNVKRETYVKGNAVETLTNKMIEKIPGLNKKLPAKYDVWGNLVKRDETYGEAFANAYLNPGTATQYKKTPVNDEILRLYKATQNSAVFPMSTDRDVEMDVGGERVKIQCNNEQYSELCKNTGKARKTLMNAALDSSWYQSLGNDEKVKFLTDMWSLAKTVGKVDTFPDGEILNTVDNTTYDVYVRDGAAGVLRYKQMKAEADADSSKQVSKGETLVYLKGQDWSSEEKGKWLGTFDNDKDSATQKVKRLYGDNAMSAWYDYYSVLYADAERYRKEKGNKNVNIGAEGQIDLAKETLAKLEKQGVPKHQLSYFYDITGDSKAWREDHPYK